MTHEVRRAAHGALSFAAIACFLAMYAAIVHAQSIYRWTDDRGIVHFGNSPPPKSHAVERHMPAPPLVAAPAQDQEPAGDKPEHDEAAPTHDAQPAAPEPQVILDYDENALVGAAMQHFSGRVRNRGRSTARDVAVDILVFDEAVGFECLRSSVSVSPGDLAPGASGTYAVDLQSPCFAAGTRSDVRARWN